MAIAGDLHGSWLQEDNDLLMHLNPDGVLFVGDLGDADLKLVKLISSLPIPTAVILGNHDRGKDLDGSKLKAQISLLANKNCAWDKSNWNNPLVSVVGARPCSAGGGYYLSPQMKAVFGHVSLDESVRRIVKAASDVPKDLPLIILAHSGPTGLGSDVTSPCGRDWKTPSVDWGDKDLELSIDQIRKSRDVDLVVFGHMHHQLKRGKGQRKTCHVDNLRDTVYLNTACVPRRGRDANGVELCHFSWVEFSKGKLINASHRWFRNDHSLAFKDTVYSRF
ncbi:TIGR04168 family protein [Prochlorococcus marinus]|uniref:TIGR04168 family protein n=2 Tax=Prochlorococcus TaxID=1218 RepID=UPI000907A194